MQKETSDEICDFQFAPQFLLLKKYENLISIGSNQNNFMRSKCIADDSRCIEQ